MQRLAHDGADDLRRRAYLVGTRTFLRGSRRVPRVVRVLVIVVTSQLARLTPALSAHAYLWALSAWVGMCAALTTRPAPEPEPEPA